MHGKMDEFDNLDFVAGLVARRQGSLRAFAVSRIRRFGLHRRLDRFDVLDFAHRLVVSPRATC